MKKFFKISAVILALGILVIVILLWIKHEPLPEGKSGPEAEALAQQMLIAMNYETFEKTRYLEWSYRVLGTLGPPCPWEGICNVALWYAPQDPRI